MSHTNNDECCTVALSRGCNTATLGGNDATSHATPYATKGLKALAHKALECNKPCNSDATNNSSCATLGAKKQRQMLHRLQSYSAFKLHELREAAGDDWHDIKDSKEMLSTFASALRDGVQRRMGIVPDHYTQDVHCLTCGDVKLWEGCSDVVHGCPWCP